MGESAKPDVGLQSEFGVTTSVGPEGDRPLLGSETLPSESAAAPLLGVAFIGSPAGRSILRVGSVEPIGTADG